MRGFLERLLFIFNLDGDANPPLDHLLTFKEVFIWHGNAALDQIVQLLRDFVDGSQSFITAQAIENRLRHFLLLRHQAGYSARESHGLSFRSMCVI